MLTPLGAAMVLPKPYYRQLMAAADRLLLQDEATPAIIMAFTACEVLTEQAFDELWPSRGLPELARPVSRALRSNNLADERVRSVYNALSADRIEGQSFWDAFKDLATLRNGLVHGKERRVSDEQAQSAIDAARALQACIVRRLYPYAMPTVTR